MKSYKLGLSKEIMKAMNFFNLKIVFEKGKVLLEILLPLQCLGKSFEKKDTKIFLFLSQICFDEK